jgi:hypothetical protein
MKFSDAAYDVISRIEEVVFSPTDKKNGYTIKDNKVIITHENGYENLVKNICPEITGCNCGEALASGAIYGISESDVKNTQPFSEFLKTEHGKKLSKLLNLPLPEQ